MAPEKIHVKVCKMTSCCLFDRKGVQVCYTLLRLRLLLLLLWEGGWGVSDTPETMLHVSALTSDIKYNSNVFSAVTFSHNTLERHAALLRKSPECRQ